MSVYLRGPLPIAKGLEAALAHCGAGRSNRKQLGSSHGESMALAFQPAEQSRILIDFVLEDIFSACVETESHS